MLPYQLMYKNLCIFYIYFYTHQILFFYPTGKRKKDTQWKCKIFHQIDPLHPILMVWREDIVEFYWMVV